MRKIITFALFVAFVFCAMAQPKASLFIKSQHHEKFFVYVNNQQMNARPTESICLTEMPSKQNFMLQVVLDNHNGTSTTMQVQLFPGDNYYNLDYFDRADRLSLVSTRRSIRTDNYVSFNRHPEPGPIVPAAPHDNHGHQPQPPHGNPHQAAPGHHPQHHGEPAHPAPGHHPEGAHQPQPQPQPQPQHHGEPAHPAPGHHPEGAHQPQPQPQPQHHGEVAPPPPQPCSDRDFQEAKRLVEKQTFDSDKLKIAKQITQSELLTSRQIADIARLLEFESNKLEYLKFAYAYCYDPNRYYLVNNVFEFNSSIDELDRYVDKFRR